ncbi:MAG: hypothetical protein WAX04_03665 [Oscillospiraceae bacterium]
MSDKKVDITGKYSREIQNIKNKLQQLEDGRIYEKTGAQMDGYLATNIGQLRKMIAELLYKIEYDKDSINDQLSEAIDYIKL